TSHFNAVLALLNANQNCASDDQIANFLVPYSRLLILIPDINTQLPRLRRLGDDQRIILIRIMYVVSLLMKTQNRTAGAIESQVSLMAQRLGDDISRAYANLSNLLVSTVVAPKRLDDFLCFKEDFLAIASATGDAFLLNMAWWAVSWDEA